MLKLSRDPWDPWTTFSLFQSADPQSADPQRVASKIPHASGAGAERPWPVRLPGASYRTSLWLRDTDGMVQQVRLVAKDTSIV